MKSSRQMLLNNLFKQKLVHGGELGLGKRKVARPINTKKSLHVTLRSSFAIGKYSLRVPQHLAFIENLVNVTAKKWGIRIYKSSINGNHMHFVLRGETRRGIQNFMRVLAAQTATFITGARKGKPFGKRFWDVPVWSRIAEWGKAFRFATKYVTQNVLETFGIIPYRPRSKKRDQKFQIRKKSTC